MPSYLEQLKKAVADAFQDASDKATVDKMVQINAIVDNVERENAALQSKNHELLTAYKEVVAHPGVSLKEPMGVTDQPKASGDFADFLASHL